MLRCLGLRASAPPGEVIPPDAELEVNGITVKDLGWRQGSFLPADEVSRLAAAYRLDGVSHAVLLSQDCDVVHHSLDDEPYAEVLFLTPLEKVNPGLRDGKSSRCLHLEARHDGGVLCFKAQPWHRVQIPRVSLAKFKPESALVMEGSVLRTLIEWVAERYTRTAFPDAFVDRIDAIDDALKKLLKKQSDLFWRILVQLEPQSELEAGADYELSVLCVVHHAAWNEAEKQQKAKSVAEKMQAQLRKCAGINLVSFEVDSDEELPLSTLSYYRTWDIFNYLTHRDRLDGEKE